MLPFISRLPWPRERISLDLAHPKMLRKPTTSYKTKELIEKEFKVRVKLRTSLNADKGKSDKSPKTLPTLNVV